MTTNNSANITTPLSVSEGGSGLTSFSTFQVVCAGTTSTGALQQIASVGTLGQLLTSNGASALPTMQTNKGGMTIWNTAASGTAMLAGNGYINTNTSTQQTFTLPATAAIGDIFEITGTNASIGWKITYNSGQKIIAATTSSTISTGNISSPHHSTSVKLICIVTNTTFMATEFSEAPTVV